jgi:hypothetical protein
MLVRDFYAHQVERGFFKCAMVDYGIIANIQESLQPSDAEPPGDKSQCIFRIVINFFKQLNDWRLNLRWNLSYTCSY